MIVYQCDVNGFYIYTSKATESPLEPGVFMIPGGCVEQEPPICTEEEVVRWDGTSWEILNRKDVDPDFKSAIDLARIKRDSLLQEADIIVNKIMDGTKGLGKIKDWRAYRVALRAWPESLTFPHTLPEMPV